ncbi:MAG TPA: DUF5110 domain-containing protein, partial [Prolixibacteraceae bacterium]|nr:DUF5110 domain-containing protein [Prolixibacteraceae bacterium]
TGKKLNGGNKINKETTIENIPVFVKEGSIVPMMVPDTVNVYEVRVYPGADSEFIFFLDDKNSHDYKNGLFAEIEFEYNDRRERLSIKSLEGEYPDFPEQITFRVVLVNNDNGHGCKISDEYETIIYDGSSTRIKF